MNAIVARIEINETSEAAETGVDFFKKIKWQIERFKVCERENNTRNLQKVIVWSI